MKNLRAMEDSFVIEESDFIAYSAYHGWPLLIIGIIGVVLILTGLKINSRQGKRKLLFGISLVPALAVIKYMIIKMAEGHFDVQEDLPLHICRIAALMLPWVIWIDKRVWLGIFYFWILAGTLNANITPDIPYNHPHWTYYSYWLLHSFLVIIPLYYIIVLKIRIVFRDLVNAFVAANIYLLFTLVINTILGSNYMYSRQKPPVASLLDVLGPWPVYLVTGQFLMLGLFLLLYLPFMWKKDHNTTIR